MPYDRPTLPQLKTRITGDLETSFGTGTLLKRALLKILGKVWAFAMHGCYGMVDWAWRQIIPDLAEALNMLRWAALWLVTPIPASYAQRQFTFTGTDGSEIDTDALIQRQDGVQYSVDAIAIVAAGTVTVLGTCKTPGTVGNVDPGTAVSLVSPIAGINSQGTVAATGTVDAVETESNASVLGRFLERLQNPPEGGNDDDYERWAKEVAGVTRAWCLPNWMGPGTVGLVFVREDDLDGPIPSAGEVTAVQDHIDPLKPNGAELFAFAPIADPTDFNIALSPNTADVQAAVEAELRDLYRRKSVPGGVEGAVIRLSWIRDAISSATGEDYNNLIAPVADITPANGHFPTVGAFTWS
jgi:uncharacterized phage protein gp47/JayE